MAAKNVHDLNSWNFVSPAMQQQVSPDQATQAPPFCVPILTRSIEG